MDYANKLVSLWTGTDSWSISVPGTSSISAP